MSELVITGQEKTSYNILKPFFGGSPERCKEKCVWSTLKSVKGRTDLSMEYSKGLEITVSSSDKGKNYTLTRVNNEPIPFNRVITLQEGPESKNGGQGDTKMVKKKFFFQFTTQRNFFQLGTD